MLMRRQFVLTLILMPITFGIWYAAGTLFAAPAVWLCDFLLSSAYPNIVEAVGLRGVEVLVRTQFGEDGGVIMAAADAGNQIALEINTRLVSYSIAFYAALLMASNLKDAIYKFCYRPVLALAHHGLWFGFNTGQRLTVNGRRAFPQRTGRAAR
jgi:hypothetical protein